MSLSESPDQELAMKMANELIESTDGSHDSDSVNTILASLMEVEAYQGVMEKRKEVQVWVTSKAKSIASNDLLKMMQSPANQSLDMARVKYCLAHSGAWPDHMWACFPSFLARLLNHAVIQAGFPQQCHFKEINSSVESVESEQIPQ